MKQARLPSRPLLTCFLNKYDGLEMIDREYYV